jgi:hypothetical protein
MFSVLGLCELIATTTFFVLILKWNSSINMKQNSATNVFPCM